MSIHNLPSRVQGVLPPPPPDDPMDSRVAKIEAVLPMLASKGDVSEAKAAIIMWMAGLIFAAVALILTVLTVVLNRVVPPAASQQPIVIQLPATPNITSPVQKKP